MKLASPLSEIHKLGLYGDYDGKNQEDLIKISEVTNLSVFQVCLLYTSPSPRDLSTSRMPSSA